MSVAAPQIVRTPRHLKVSGVNPSLSFEPCEDPGCVVEANGTASSCRRLACPSCGCGGTNLSTMQVTHVGPLSCTCGFVWIHDAH
jgi:hypothetical protein